MPTQKAPALATIFSEVLADLAFMFTDEEGSDVLPGENWLQTTIQYKGVVAGELRFTCTRSFTCLLAANLLGVAEPDPTDVESTNDAVKEFMNIVCGQYVTANHGTEDVFDLTIPEVKTLEGAPDPVMPGDNRQVSLTVEGHQVQLAYEPIG